MNVSIYSRKAIEELINHDFPSNTAVISFYDPETGHDYGNCIPVDYRGKCSRLFYVCIHDIDMEVLEDYNLSFDTYFPEADLLVDFILQAEAEGMDIICQCEYGQSRSAACAAAIVEYFYGNGISIFSDYRYYPNQLIYNKLLQALRRQTNKEYLDVLILTCNCNEFYLAYIDLETNELIREHGCIRNPGKLLEDNCACPSSDLQIHHMKIRKKKNGVFYFAECIEKNIHCKELEDIAQKYEKPFIYENKILGTFFFERDYPCYYTTIDWLNNSLEVSLLFDDTSDAISNQSLETFEFLCLYSKETDNSFKTYILEEIIYGYLQKMDNEAVINENLIQYMENNIYATTLDIFDEGGFEIKYVLDYDSYKNIVITMRCDIESGVKDYDIHTEYN